MSIDVSKLTPAELAALVPQLLAQLEEANKPRALTFKVSEKGAVSIFGLQKFPVTLYRSQLERIFAERERLAAFIRANASLLKTKGE